VIIAGRRKEAVDAATAANAGMKSVALDVRKLAGLETFAAGMARQHAALNVLIKNAGIMRVENLQEASGSSEVEEAIVTTNLLAPMRLTAAMLPLLKRQNQETVMTVSSGLAFLPIAIAPT